jgi:glycosyltransferase involved in cell wall biosynthesis
METPKVSVIMPAYNAGRYIRESLDSIFAQTYKTYEVIVVDDGSTDETQSILKEYPGVRCLYIHRRGPAAARNIGIRNSDGEFIAFLDSDDIWLPEKLAKQVKEMIDDPETGLLFTENSFFNQAGIISGYLDKRKRLMEGDIVQNIFWKSGIVTPTVMVRRKVFDQVGYFEEGLICSEDDNMWMRIANQTKVSLLDEQLVLVRVRDNSLSKTKGNIFSGVKAHLALLESKYPELREKLGKLVEMKHAVLNTAQGLMLLDLNKRREARQEFLEAIRYRPMSASNYAYWCVTFLPVPLLDLLRKIKRAVNKSNGWLQV